MIRIVFGWIAAAQVVQGAAHASFVATHFDTKRRFAGIGEELRAVVHGFANRRHFFVRGVEHAEGAVTETRACGIQVGERSEEHTSELQSLMRISYAVFCLKKKKDDTTYTTTHQNPQKHDNKTTSYLLSSTSNSNHQI